MALMITEGCINCGYCELECPNQAIYEPGMKWSMADGTSLKFPVSLYNGREVNPEDELEPLSEQTYFIVPDKCTECKGMYNEPQCLVVCPDPECLIIPAKYRETDEKLFRRHFWLNW